MTNNFLKTLTKAFRVAKRSTVVQNKTFLPQSALKIGPSVQNHIAAHAQKSATGPSLVPMATIIIRQHIRL